MTASDRIQKQVFLKATQTRVWRAIATPAEFGVWFGVKLDAEFVPGHIVRGKFNNPKYAALTWEMLIDRMEPERLFAFRWHPYAIDLKADYSQEEHTLVVFELQAVEGGTELTVTESGFDKVPLARRAEAFRMNEMGWGMQMENVKAHVEKS